jgi:hypothetical protein
MAQFLKYLWALPATGPGLLAAVVTLLTGGRVRVVQGCLEVSGGFARWLLRRGTPLVGGASAMTLGHVILGQDRTCLDRSRAHEHVHVRQAERWGPFFLPAYLAASGWLWLTGRGDAYLANPFEVEAYNRVSQIC